MLLINAVHGKPYLYPVTTPVQSNRQNTKARDGASPDFGNPRVELTYNLPPMGTTLNRLAKHPRFFSVPVCIAVTT